MSSWEPVSVFVSSTFNDMHAERDYLVKRVFPELREWCEQRKLRLVDIDLRWGVTEADATNRNVVKICLEHIDKCRPFFICFLGQRRGWVPGKGEITPDTCTAYPDLKKYIGEASVTEMEILHSVIDPLNNKERADRSFFYLRDPSYLGQLPKDATFLRNIYTNEGFLDPDARAMADTQLNNWRENIIPQTSRPVHHYSASWNQDESTPELALPLQCPSQVIQNKEKWKNRWRELGINPPDFDLTDEGPVAQDARKKNLEITKGRLGSFRCEDMDLAEVILDDLKKAIAQKYPDHMHIEVGTPLQKELDQQEQFLDLNCNGFIHRTGDFDALDAYVTGNSDDLFVLTAPGGMGKTMLLANWIWEFQQRSETPVFYRFIGGSDGSTTVDSVLRSLLTEITARGLPDQEIPLDPTELRNTFHGFLTSIGSHTKVVIVIDALNQLESGLKDLYWLPKKLPPGIKLVVSFKRSGEEAENLASQLKNRLPCTFLEIRPFDSLEDRRSLISAYLEQYLKQLDDTYIQALIESKGAENPLFLKVVLSELRIFGSFDTIGQKIREDFGTTPIEAFQAVLKRLENDPSFTRIAPEQGVPLLFGLISHARVGLYENELINLFARESSCDKEAAKESIRLWLRQVRSFLALRAGRYDFFYESFRRAAIKRYEGNNSDLSQRTLTEWHTVLADYFEQLPAWVSPKENRPTIRRASELPYHLAWAGKAEHLGDLILEYELLDTVVFGLGPNAAIEAVSLVLSPPTPLEKGGPTKKTALALVHGALRLSSHILTQKRNQLPSQLVGRLLESEDPDIREFVQIVKRFDRYPWLCPINTCLISPGRSLIRTLTGHTKMVRAVAVTPDGRRIVSGSLDSTLKVWDLESGRELATLAGHKDGVNSVVITPDGHRAISGSIDRTLKIWDLENGRELQTLTGHSREVYDVAVTPDGRRVVSVASLGEQWVWDLESGGGGVATITGPSLRAYTVAVLPDNRRAVSGSICCLNVWDLENGKELRTLDGHFETVCAVAVTPDGRRAVSGAGDFTLKVWDLESGRELATLAGHKHAVTSVAITQDGRRVVSGSWDSTLKVWDLENGRELQTLTDHYEKVSSVAITRDGRRVVSGSWDSTLKVWDLEKEASNITGHTGRVNAIVVTPDGRKAVTASDDKTLKIWDLGNGRELATLTGHTKGVNDVAVTPDGRKAVTASDDKTLKIWDLGNGRELATLAGHEGSVNSVVITPDGRRALSNDYLRIRRLWNLESGQELHWRQVVFELWDSTQRILNLNRLWKRHDFVSHSDRVDAVAITPDGRRAVLRSSNCKLMLWDLDSGSVIAEFCCGSPITTWSYSHQCHSIIGVSKGGLISILRLEGISQGLPVSTAFLETGKSRNLSCIICSIPFNHHRRTKPHYSRVTRRKRTIESPHRRTRSPFESEQ